MILTFFENFNSVEGIIALVTFGIILAQLIGSVFIGADTDLDLDADGVDFDFSSIISPKGIIHFLAGYSWYLVLSEIMRGERTSWDWIIGAIVGLVVSILIMLLYWGLSKLACEHKLEAGDDLVGRSGTVYLDLSGSVVINITINGAKRELTVASKSKKNYSVGEIVTIIEFKDGIYFIE